MKHGNRIQNEPLFGAIATGIGYKKYHDLIVAPYEEHDARASAGYKLFEWYALLPEERALEVALNRMRITINNHREAEIAKKTKPRRK